MALYGKFRVAEFAGVDRIEEEERRRARAELAEER